MSGQEQTNPEMSGEALPDFQALAQSLARESIELLIQARVDNLTGTLTQCAFQDTLLEEHKCCLKSDKIYRLAVIEIDHIENATNATGHASEDDCLKRVAAALQGVIRGSDFLGRHGKSRFALLLTDTDLQEAEIVGNRLSQTIADEAISYPDSGTERFASLTIGIAQFDGQSHENVIERAEQALSQAKTLARDKSDAEPKQMP